MALTRIGPNQSVNLTSNVTGTLPVGNGGIGIASGTTDQFLKFTGTTTLASAADNVGKILQIVQKIDTTSRSTTSSTYTSGIGGALQITPSATSSKILIIASVTLYIPSGTAYATIAYQGSSIATNSTSAFIVTDGNSRYYSVSGLHFLHSPNTTDTKSYDILMKNTNNSTTVETPNSGSQAVLTLMEIAG